MHTFLFGAGADQAYGLCEGVGFAAPLMFGEFSNERKALLGVDASSSTLVFPQSRTVFLQTVENFTEEAKEVFDEKTIENMLVCYNKSDSPEYKVASEVIFGKNSNGTSRAEWYNKTKKYYEKIKQDSSKRYLSYEQLDADDRIGKFFLSNMVFFDSIDEKFNSLRNAERVNSKAKRVINAYFTVFILMLKSLYVIGDDFKFDYESIFDLLNQSYNKIDIKLDSEKSYYKILSKLNPKSYNIVTTNYTDICKKVINKEVTYLHGNMRWFEDYKHLQVYDISVSEEREELLKNKSTIMPFLLIPSGVKPIICTKQIQQFSEFISKLEESQILWVVGYKFNSEDNHINSIILNWLKQQNNKMIYLNYDNSVEWHKLLWTEGLKIKVIDSYSDKVKDYIKSNEIDVLSFNVKENCYKMFKLLLNEFSELRKGDNYEKH